MMQILLASRNAHKAEEFTALLPGVGIILWQGPDIPEDGAFFQDNARQKAIFALDWHLRHGSEAIDGVLADDSGLCVDALFGGPGVLSARFAPRLDYAEKNPLLLSMINPEEPRTCRFVCVLAYASARNHGLAPITVSGTVEGTLAIEARGSNGFGYDPIFVPNGHEQTFGELPAEIKNGMSHRGKAARALSLALGLGK
jgi:XTP/dITP diphosphohydrolase